MYYIFETAEEAFRGLDELNQQFFDSATGTILNDDVSPLDNFRIFSSTGWSDLGYTFSLIELLQTNPVFEVLIGGVGFLPGLDV
ncbi:hypothetical protein, partial [Anabaena sp. CS-542/02]|uniref:hypothetical protein n=1 Tax=Anabaena sp. CS-542/02 TaxID=3021719 RepID=UPI00232B60B3